MVKNLLVSSLDFLNKNWVSILIAFIGICILIVYLIVNEVVLKLNGGSSNTGRVIILEKLTNMQQLDPSAAGLLGCIKSKGYSAEDPNNDTNTAKCMCNTIKKTCVCDWICDPSNINCNDTSCNAFKYDVSMNSSSKDRNAETHNTLIRKGFCSSYKTLEELQENCSKLPSKKSCNLTDCCAYAHISKIGNETANLNACVAADGTGGPIYKSDKNGNVLNFDYWYYLGKRYPPKSNKN